MGGPVCVMGCALAGGAGEYKVAGRHSSPERSPCARMPKASSWVKGRNMSELTTRQQATRSGHARRICDPASQQRFLRSLGVDVAIEILCALPRGAWIRYVPDGAPLRVSGWHGRR